MSSLERVTAPLALARARLWSRRGRAALAGLATAAGAALLATTLVAALTVSDRTLARGITDLPATQRSVSATWGGLVPQEPNGGLQTLDRAARRALTPITGRAPSSFLIYRETRLGGALVDLAAGDHLAPWVRLTAGRLPHTCVPGHCEVVQLAGSGPIPRGLVRVGRGSLVSEAPFGDLIGAAPGSLLSQAERFHRPATPPFLLAEGIRPVADLPGLAYDYRSYRWVVPLRPADVHPWSSGTFARRFAEAQAALGTTRWPFIVDAPVEQLAEARSTGQAGQRRLLLLGGEAAALLLAFTILAASGLRRDAGANRRRLTWLGATRGQIALESGAEAAAIAAVGAAVGWFIGIAPAAAIARHFGSPASDVVANSVLSGEGIAIVLALAAAAAIILLAAIWARPMRIGGLHVTGLDLAAVGAAVLIVIAFARGAADAGSLRGGSGTGATLLLLPGLVAFVAAVVSARAVGLLARSFERLARRGPLPLRLATLSLARNPGRSAVAVSFLVVSLGLALFASVYRATLETGERDQAAYGIPAAAIVSEDFSKLVPVNEAAPQQTYDRYGATRVIRLTGNIPAGRAFTLVAMPSASVAGVDGWRSDFSSLSRAEIGRRIAPAAPVALRGIAAPAGRLTLPLSATGLVRVRAAIETERGGFRYVELPGRIPAARLLGFTFDLTGRGLEREAISGEGAHAVGSLTLRLGRPQVDGRPLPVDFRAWTGTGGVRAATGERTAAVRFLATSDVQPAFRLRQPMDGSSVPVVVSPDLAALAGKSGALPIDIEGTPVAAHVVGVTKRFPSVDGDVVLADLDSLATALNADHPGAAVVNEAWLGEIPPAGPPFDVLRVRTQQGALDRLTSDPLARGSLLALLTAAFAGLGLALAGLLLVVVTDQRDERGELFDLEAQGATPLMLRLHLRLRAAIVAGLGLVGGIATGAVLGALVVELVKVTANATEPEPPLVLAVDWRVLGLGLLAFIMAATLVVVTATWRAFRAESAGRFAEAGW